MNTRHLHILTILVALLLAIGILAACAPATPTGTFPPSSNAPAQAPTNAPTSAPANPPTSAPTNAPAAAGAVTLQVANNSTLGNFLTDGKGMTLYLFLKDTKNTSNCYDACAAKWPPLVSQAKPTLGDGLKADLVGTTLRKDGTTQITYNGWPLYYYAPDGKPGDATGQGVGNVWYVLSAAGDAITTGAAPAAPAPAKAPTSAPVNPYKY